MSFFIFLRATLVDDGSMIFYSFFSEVSLTMGRKIEFFSSYAGAPLSILFAYSLYPYQALRKYVKAFLILSGIFLVIVLVTPYSFFYHTLDYYNIVILISYVLMFTILVLQFNSLRFPVYVLTVIPTAFVGLFIGLLITGQALSFPSLMGLIALSGIVVNNAIILIDTINSKRKAAPEEPIAEVVIAGSEERLRPIMLTTITTIIGMAPLTLASELWAPLAWAVMFGLTFTSIATLFLIPILYTRQPGKLS